MKFNINLKILYPTIYVFRAKNNGFSLVELIVSTAIITILAGVLVINSNLNNSKFALENAAQYLVSNIRLTQGRSIAPESGSLGVYGIYFNIQSHPTSYILFKDTSNPTNGIYDGLSEFISEIQLPPQIRISQLMVDNITQNSVSVAYKAPIPIVTIDNQINKSNVKITLTKGTENKIVVIETSNNVEIQ